MRHSKLGPSPAPPAGFPSQWMAIPLPRLKTLLMAQHPFAPHICSQQMLCLSLQKYVSVLDHFLHLLCYTWHNVPETLARLPSRAFLNTAAEVQCQIKPLLCSKLSTLNKSPNLSVICLLCTSLIDSYYTLHSSHDGLVTIQSHQATADLRSFALALASVWNVLSSPGSDVAWLTPFLHISQDHFLWDLPDHPTLTAPTTDSSFPCLLYFS